MHETYYEAQSELGANELPGKTAINSSFVNDPAHYLERSGASDQMARKLGAENGSGD